jgi:hypothetical protein
VSEPVREYLVQAKSTLVGIISMNRVDRRRAGFRAPVKHYETQLTRVLRDLGEIA